MNQSDHQLHFRFLSIIPLFILLFLFCAVTVHAQDLPSETNEVFSLQTAANRKAALNSSEQSLYDTVYRSVASIASGKRESTVITLGDVRGNINLKKVLCALMDDYPYEFYWFDKSGQISARSEDGSVNLYLPVAPDFSIKKQKGTYTLDSSAAKVAQKAIQNARSIVAKAANMDTYRAFSFFEDQICQLASYDTNSNANVYGNPWQLLWVFDGDPDTNVVCEGYAKAFKYLCDLWIRDHASSAECYLVDGTIKAGLRSGNHMWNVVHMDDGKNYVADLTTEDDLGIPSGLFLKGSENIKKGTYQNVSRTLGYTINGSDGWVITYTYSTSSDAYCLDLYSEDEIGINSADYHPAADSSDGKNTDAAALFQDVPANAYYTSALTWAVTNGISSGTTRQTFSPSQKCTRAQMVEFLYRLSGSPKVQDSLTFTDVPDSAYYRDAVIWAVNRHITAGTSDSTFEPNAYCKRSQMAQFLYALKGKPAVTVGDAFIDVAATSYYASAVYWLKTAGITAGKTATEFKPDDYCTRAEMVMLLWKYSQN